MKKKSKWTLVLKDNENFTKNRFSKKMTNAKKKKQKKAKETSKFNNLKNSKN